MSSDRFAVPLLLVALLLGVLGVLALGGEEREIAQEPVTRNVTSPRFPPLAAGAMQVLLTPTGVIAPVVGEQDGQPLVLTPCGATAPVEGGVLVAGAHVVIDPGHGGDEPGAVGPTGLVEKDVNLAVALRTKERLEAAGAKVILTRSSDLRVTIETRAAIATALQPLVFVSIHHNAAPVAAATRPGSEVYFTEGSADARRFAGLLWEEFQAQLGPFGSDWAVAEYPGVQARLSTAGTDFYGVLRRPVGVDSVLSESVFISDPEEELLLRDPAFLDAEAAAITDTVERFLDTADPGSGYRETLVSDRAAGGGGGTDGCVDPPLS